VNPFHSLIHHPGLTQSQHRALPGISNTDLGRIADEALGRPQRNCAAAYAFGAYFHSALLEPATRSVGPDAASEDDALTRTRAAALAKVIRRQRYPRHVLYWGAAEQSYTATHEPTGLIVKVRPDLIIDSPKRTRRTLIDFKTTSCATRDQFLATVEAYDYDRQGALYADVLGAQRVVLLAVQKRPRKDAPPAVWRVELTPEQLATGRKKYGRLLREIIRTAG
jgi:PDDEXK-like domain of unknown function (DUF3799)